MRRSLRSWLCGGSRSFDLVAGIELGAGGGPLVTGPDGSVDPVERQSVTARFFDVLGVPAVAGRTFQASDDASTANVVVFSESLWRRRFNADPALVGGTVKLNGVPYTVLGVVPDHAQLARPARMWTLRRLRNVPPFINKRSVRVVEVVRGVVQQPAVWHDRVRLLAGRSDW